jgi:FHA domain
MFFRHLDFVFAPFRAVYNKFLTVRNIKGNIKTDMNRGKAMVGRGKGMAQAANQKVAGLGGQAAAAQQQMQQAVGQQQPQQGHPPQQGGYPQQHAGYPQQYQQGANMQQPGYPPQGGGFPPGMPQQQPGMPGMPGGAPGMPPSSPPIRTSGFWFWKKKFCPFCAQIAQQAAAAPAKLQKLKTQALVLDPSGTAGIQLLGWLVPLQGPQKGELFTLQIANVIGTTPDCNICLHDKFMSSKHAEIKAENGMWVLRDAGSTNGTYVNRRVDRHELVDNDFIKFGSAMVKFKSL